MSEQKQTRDVVLFSGPVSALEDVGPFPVPTWCVLARNDSGSYPASLAVVGQQDTSVRTRYVYGPTPFRIDAGARLIPNGPVYLTVATSREALSEGTAPVTIPTPPTYLDRWRQLATYYELELGAPTDPNDRLLIDFKGLSVSPVTTDARSASYLLTDPEYYRARALRLDIFWTLVTGEPADTLRLTIAPWGESTPLPGAWPDETELQAYAAEGRCSLVLDLSLEAIFAGNAFASCPLFTAPSILLESSAATGSLFTVGFNVSALRQESL